MKTLLVYCHPDPDSFVSAVRDRAVEAITGAGHELRVSDLYADRFDPLFSAVERASHLDEGSDPAVAGYADDLAWCERLVLVYPTWWSGQPAMLKGWVDRVWVRGIAWELPAGANRVRGQLRNVRRIVIVTTHGSSKFVNVAQGEAGKRTVRRTLRAVCHPLARTKWLAMYGVDKASPDKRAAFLAKVGKRLR